jgi:cytochrome c biogenesis protein ResB
MKTKKSKTWFVSIIIFILFGLLSCTYPNKMDSIAKALSKIKK